MPVITIDVENRSATKQGEGPISSAYGVEFDNPLSQAGTFRFRVPKADDRNSLLSIKSSVIRIWEDTTQVFVGVVEGTRTVIESDGTAALEVTGRNMAAELDEFSVGFLSINSGTSAVSNAPDLIMASATGWTITGGNATSETLYGRFAGESHLAALIMVHERTGDNWRLSNSADRTVNWLTSFSDSGVRAIGEGSSEAVELEDVDEICLITDLTVIEDGFELVNKVYPYGAGHSLAGSGLTLAPSTYNGVTGDFNVTRASNFIVYQPSGYSQPTITRYLDFKDIEPLSGTDADLQSAANMLAEATFRYLERYGNPQTTYELSVVKLPTTVQPGTTIRVKYYREDADRTVIHDIDETLNVLNVRTRYDDSGAAFYTLTVSDGDRFPASDEAELIGRLQQGQIFQMHRQLSANSYRAPYRVFIGEDQTDDKGEIRFLFDSETVQLQQVLFRFKIERLVSPTNTVGGTTATSNAAGGEAVTSGASSVVTTAGGDAHNHTVSDHQHGIGLNQGTGGLGVTGFHGPGDAFGLQYDGTDVGLKNIYTDNNPGAVTSTDESSHTHGMDHNHTVTTNDHQHTVDIGGALSTTFGIFRALLVDTMDIDDLEYQVNSGGWSDLNGATVLGGDLYEIDISSSVYNSTTLRPTSNDNTLEIRHKYGIIIGAIGGLGGGTGQFELQTTSAHRYAAGDAGVTEVTIDGTASFDGTYTIASVPDSTHLRFNDAGKEAIATENPASATVEEGVTCMVDGFLKVREIIQS